MRERRRRLMADWAAYCDGRAHRAAKNRPPLDNAVDLYNAFLVTKR
jgi:hypothetical protein